MADLDTIQTQLGAWIKAITASTIGASDGLAVYWRDKPAGWRGDHALCFISGLTGVGRDELVYDEDLGDPGNEIKFYQRGQRQLTLDIQIKTYRATAGYNAREYARRIRDRIMLPDWSSYFSAADVAFQRIANETDLSELVDNRKLSAAQLDIVFNASSLEQGASNTYIEIVEAETTFRRPDGSLSPNNFSGEIEVG